MIEDQNTLLKALPTANPERLRVMQRAKRHLDAASDTVAMRKRKIPPFGAGAMLSSPVRDKSLKLGTSSNASSYCQVKEICLKKHLSII